MNNKNTVTLIFTIAVLLTISIFQSPGLKALDSFPDNPTRATNPLQVTILSWNIAMLPIFDFVHSGKDRATSIGDALQSKDYDIIVFQEAFSSIARRAIYQKLHTLYPYNYGPANANAALKINSGIWILSRIPLSIIREYKFSDCQGFDCISKKGAILLEGQCNDQTFQIIGTHLESDDSDLSVRMAQLNELYNNIIRPFSNPDIPQIICGDFNTDRELTEQYLNMLKILNCEDGNLSGDEKITFGFPINKKVQKAIEKPRQLDYILTKNSDVLDVIKRKVSVIQGMVAAKDIILSDHYGIEATIVFKPSVTIAGSLQ